MRTRAETRYAVATGIGGIGLDRAVWALQYFGVVFEPWQKTFAAATVLVALGISALIFLHLVWDWARKNSWGKSVGVGMMLAGLGLFIWGAYTVLHPSNAASTEPRRIFAGINWDFDSGKPEVYFLSLSEAPNGPMTLNAFQAGGVNAGDDPINITRMYIRSDTTNLTLPVLFYLGNPQLVDPKDTRGIPPKADFRVQSANVNTLHPDQPIQIPVAIFLKDFSAFTFVVEAGGKKYERHFSADEVRAQIAMFAAKAARELSGDQGPRIMQVPPRTDLFDNKVSLECTVAMLPKHLPASESLIIAQLSVAQNDGQAGQVVTKYGHAGTALSWDAAGHLDGAYRCELRNDAGASLFDISMSFAAYFNAVEKVNDESPVVMRAGPVIHVGALNVRAKRLDAGKDSAFIFYFINQSAYWAAAVAPSEITAKTADGEIHTIKIIVPGTDLDKRMLFGPIG